MADNKIAPATGSGSATPTFRTKDRAGVDTPVVAIDLNPAGSESLMAGRMPVEGAAAHDAGVAGSPLAVGGRASDALPSEVNADGDAVWQWLLRNGAAVVAGLPHLGMIADPFTLTAKTAQYTTTQTGVALWTPAAGKRLVITSVQIQAGGTVAGTVQLWFGASADTAYTRGTDLAIFDGEFAPSSTLKPGFTAQGLWIAGAADHLLRVTDSAAINPLTVTVWGYEV